MTEEEIRQDQRWRDIEILQHWSGWNGNQLGLGITALIDPTRWDGGKWSWEKEESECELKSYDRGR